MNTLQYYREHKSEIDALSDTRAVLLLGLVNTLKTTTLEEVSNHLGLPAAEVVTMWRKLVEAGFGSETLPLGSGTPFSMIQVTPDGVNILQMLGLEATRGENVTAGSRSSGARTEAVTRESYEGDSFRGSLSVPSLSFIALFLLGLVYSLRGRATLHPQIIVSFVVVFALMLLAVNVGLNYFDARRKKQVVDMLRAASGEPVITMANLLKEIENEKPMGLKRLLNSLQFSRHASEQIQQAGLNWSASRLIAAMGLMMIAGLGLGAMVPFLLNVPVAAVVLALIFGLSPYLIVRHKRSKRLASMEEQFPEALDFLARSMRAGHAFSISLEMLGEELPGPLGHEFRALFNEQNQGAPLDIALHSFTMRVPLLDVRFFTSSVLLQKQTGGNLAEILERLHFLVRERSRLCSRLRTADARGRLWSVLLAWVPLGVGVLTYVLNPEAITFLLNTRMGRSMLVLAVCTTLAGRYAASRALKPGYLIVPSVILLLTVLMLHELHTPVTAPFESLVDLLVVRGTLGSVLLIGALVAGIILSRWLVERIWSTSGGFRPAFTAPLAAGLFAVLCIAVVTRVVRVEQRLTLGAVPLLLVAVCLIILLFAVILPIRRDRVLARLGSPVILEGRSRSEFEPAVVRLLRMIGNKLGIVPAELAPTRRRLIEAGFREPDALPIFYGMRVVLALALPALGTLPMIGSHTAPIYIGLTVMALAIAGVFLPHAYLRLLSLRRQSRIRRALPDFLDFLAIALESGLGLDQAVSYASHEIEGIHPEMSEECALVDLEMRAGKRRSEALRNLAARTAVDDVRRLVAVLIQSDRFGTRVAGAIHSYSSEMRSRAIHIAEEAIDSIDVRLAIALVCFLLTLAVITQPQAFALRLTQVFQFFGNR